MNLTRYLASSEPIEVYNTFVEKPRLGVDNRGSGTLKFSNGILANLNYSINSYEQGNVKIIGEYGKVYVPGIFEINSEDKIIYLEKLDEKIKIKIEGRDYYYLEVKEFADAVLKGGDLLLIIKILVII